MLLSCQPQDASFIVEASHPDMDLVNGVLLFKKRPFNGTLNSYYTPSKLKAKTIYRNGKKEGLEVSWHPSGSVATNRFYSKGIKTGVHKGWWDHGLPKYVYHFNALGTYHGNIKEWYRNGGLFRDFNYEHGQEVGLQQLRHLDGPIKANYEVVNGERFGLIGLKKCFRVTTGSQQIK